MNTKLGLLAGCAIALSFGASAAWAGYEPAPGDFPPNAKPGHCYGKVLISEVYTTYTEQVLDHAEAKETRIIPAVYGWEDKQILVQEERVEYEVIPAQYKTITETIVTRAASTRTETIPATYDTVTDRVLVREAYTMWKRGTATAGQKVVYGSEKVLPTGEVLCLVEVPAEYRDVTRTVVRTAEQTRTIEIPAVTSTVTRTVLATPAHTIEHKIAAIYKTVKVQVVVHAEGREIIVIPATYKTVTKQKLVSPARLEWRDVECEKTAGGGGGGGGYGPPPPAHGGGYGPPPPAHGGGYGPPPPHHDSGYSEKSSAGAMNRTGRMQAALAKRGYYKGPINGRYTDEVGAAVVKFQHDNHLPAGYYDAQTAAALGLTAPPSKYDGERG